MVEDLADAPLLRIALPVELAIVQVHAKNLNPLDKVLAPFDHGFQKYASSHKISVTPSR